jgi:8-oxo-dGTP diphosphatase
MEKDFIDKLAYIYVQDGKVLVSLSKGKDTWYIPGGKREPGENDVQALAREVEEELSIKILPETIKSAGTFEAQAHGKPAGIIVRMTCYMADFEGQIAAANEIAEVAMFGFKDKAKTGPVDHIIFDDLKAKGLID